MLEAFRTTVLLKQKLNTPFVHLCTGRYGRLQRHVAPTLGAALTFGMRSDSSMGQCPQPLVSTARGVLNELNWRVHCPKRE